LRRIAKNAAKVAKVRAALILEYLHPVEILVAKSPEDAGETARIAWMSSRELR